MVKFIEFYKSLNWSSSCRFQKIYLDILTYNYITLLIWDLYFLVWYSNFSDFSFKSVKYNHYFTDLSFETVKYSPYFTDLTLYFTAPILGNFQSNLEKKKFLAEQGIEPRTSSYASEPTWGQYSPYFPVI